MRSEEPPKLSDAVVPPRTPHSGVSRSSSSLLTRPARSGGVSSLPPGCAASVRRAPVGGPRAVTRAGRARPPGGDSPGGRRAFGKATRTHPLGHPSHRTFLGSRRNLARCARTAPNSPRAAPRREVKHEADYVMPREYYVINSKLISVPARYSWYSVAWGRRLMFWHPPQGARRRAVR